MFEKMTEFLPPIRVDRSRLAVVVILIRLHRNVLRTALALIIDRLFINNYTRPLVVIGGTIVIHLSVAV